MDSFATHVALRERKSIVSRMRELDREKESSWRDREIGDLQRYLAEVDIAIGVHRETARVRGH